MALLDTLKATGLEIKQGSGPDEILICCIFCEARGETRDTRFRCGINLSSGQGHCHNCRWASGRALLEVLHCFNLDEGIVDEIKKIPFTKKKAQRPDPATLPADFQLLEETEIDDELYGRALKYALSRGISKAQMKRHEIGASYSEGRIIFPYRSPEGKIWGSMGRDFTGKSDYRYIYSHNLKAIWNAKLYNYSDRMVILSEGAFKALAIERAIANKFCSAALGGNSITEDKLMQLMGFKELVLFADPDIPGMDGFLRVAARASAQFRRVTLAWPWPTKQADEMTAPEIREYLRNRVEVSPAVKAALKATIIQKKFGGSLYAALTA